MVKLKTSCNDIFIEQLVFKIRQVKHWCITRRQSVNANLMTENNDRLDILLNDRLDILLHVPNTIA